tara:strand:+ start:326 stop:1480 length:1155 start_codon:yes stop_codon:yes gene_type:complete
MYLLHIFEGKSFVMNGGQKSRGFLTEIILDMGGKSICLSYAGVHEVFGFIIKLFLNKRKVLIAKNLDIPLLDSKIYSTNIFLIFKSNLKFLFNKFLLNYYLKFKLFEDYKHPNVILAELNFEEAVIFFKRLFPNSKIFWLTRSTVNCLIWSSARLNINKYRRILQEVEGIATTSKETFLMYKDYFLIKNPNFKFHELHIPLKENSLISNIIYENDVNKIKVISIFGSLGPRKGILYLLEICKEINKYYSKTVELDIFGFCPSQYNFLKNNNKNNNLKINLHGFIDKNFTLKLIKNSTIAIFPSYSENMSRAHRDCALMNIPVFINAKSFDSTLLNFPETFQSFYSSNDLLNLIDNYFNNPNNFRLFKIENNEKIIREQINKINS